uniref:Uncharacterized protein n=1 Tax=Salmonella sp. 14 TaxID=1179812 RepID=I3W2Z9_9ENTR|nr:hypothetical protein [Salmonella sp. 14]
MLPITLSFYIFLTLTGTSLVIQRRVSRFRSKKFRRTGEGIHNNWL